MKIDEPSEIAPLKNYETRGRYQNKLLALLSVSIYWRANLLAVHRVHKSPLINDPIRSRSYKMEFFIKESSLLWRSSLVEICNSLIRITHRSKVFEYLIHFWYKNFTKFSILKYRIEWETNHLIIKTIFLKQLLKNNSSNCEVKNIYIYI